MKIQLAAALALATAFAPLMAAAQMGGMSGAAPEPSRRDPAAAYNAGVIALEARNYDEAIRQFRVARRGAPNDGMINYALGVAYAGAGNNADAKGAFERAIAANNPPATAWLQLGLVALEMGDRETAATQQSALQQQIAACGEQCGDARRGQFQAALDQLSRALAR